MFKHPVRLFFIITFFLRLEAIIDHSGVHLPLYLRQRRASPTPWMKTRIDFLKALPKNAAVVEIGVQAGKFSDEILRYTNPNRLYLIDCWEEQAQNIYPNDPANISQLQQNKLFEYVHVRFAHDPRVIIIKGYTPEVAHYFQDESLDWVYIDANHTYGAVKEDLRVWFLKIKVGGFICGDDYTHTELFPIGVIPAVNEFLEKHGLQIDYMSNEPWARYAIKKTHRVIS